MYVCMYIRELCRNYVARTSHISRTTHLNNFGSPVEQLESVFLLPGQAYGVKSTANDMALGQHYVNKCAPFLATICSSNIATHRWTKSRLHASDHALKTTFGRNKAVLGQCGEIFILQLLQFLRCPVWKSFGVLRKLLQVRKPKEVLYAKLSKISFGQKSQTKKTWGLVFFRPLKKI